MKRHYGWRCVVALALVLMCTTTPCEAAQPAPTGGGGGGTPSGSPKKPAPSSAPSDVDCVKFEAAGPGARTAASCLVRFGAPGRVRARVCALLGGAFVFVCGGFAAVWTTECTLDVDALTCHLVCATRRQRPSCAALLQPSHGRLPERDRVRSGLRDLWQLWRLLSDVRPDDDYIGTVVQKRRRLCPRHRHPGMVDNPVR